MVRAKVAEENISGNVFQREVPSKEREPEANRDLTDKQKQKVGKGKPLNRPISNGAGEVPKKNISGECFSKGSPFQRTGAEANRDLTDKQSKKVGKRKTS